MIHDYNINNLRNKQAVNNYYFTASFICCVFYFSGAQWIRRKCFLLQLFPNLHQRHPTEQKFMSSLTHIFTLQYSEKYQDAAFPHVLFLYHCNFWNCFHTTSVISGGIDRLGYVTVYCDTKVFGPDIFRNADGTTRSEFCKGI